MEPLGNIFRGGALAAILIASSCAAPSDGPNPGFADGTRNHPIAVEPSYQSLSLYYAPADRGASPEDTARLEAFVADYRAHGSGSIAVSAPVGMNSAAAATFFAQRINEMGVARDHILISSHDAVGGDLRVEINYVSYVAHADSCGNWSEDLSFTLANGTPKNFGCSVQHNIAAQIADPRDLLGAQPMDDADGRRRQTVITAYDQGKVTGAEKRKADLSNEQSGTSSEVGK